MIKSQKSGSITLRLPDKEIEVLKKMALDNKISVSELIRHIIELYGAPTKRGDIEALRDSVANVTHVQQLIIAQLRQLTEYNGHLIWDKNAPHPVELDGKNVKCFPIYWVRAIKRGLK